MRPPEGRGNRNEKEEMRGKEGARSSRGRKKEKSHQNAGNEVKINSGVVKYPGFLSTSHTRCCCAALGDLGGSVGTADLGRGRGLVLVQRLDTCMMESGCEEREELEKRDRLQWTEKGNKNE